MTLTAPPSRGVDGRRFVRPPLAIGMLLELPFGVLQKALLKAGVLNTKDLPPFVDSETGSVTECALNLWHWDAMTLLLGAV